MSLEQAILDKIRHLPQANQEEVLRFADGLQRQTAIRQIPTRDRTREMKWVARNRAAFADRGEFKRDGHPTSPARTEVNLRATPDRRGHGRTYCSPVVSSKR